jgi:hypothetical protein
MVWRQFSFRPSQRDICRDILLHTGESLDLLYYKKYKYIIRNQFYLYNYKQENQNSTKLTLLKN